MRRLTLTGIPGGISLEDYSLMREVIAAIREGLPTPTKCSPVRYFSMCWGRCGTVRTMLKWTREGDAWILLYRRRRTGRVVPDKNVAFSQIKWPERHGQPVLVQR